MPELSTPTSNPNVPQPGFIDNVPGMPPAVAAEPLAAQPLIEGFPSGISNPSAGTEQPAPELITGVPGSISAPEQPVSTNFVSGFDPEAPLGSLKNPVIKTNPSGITVNTANVWAGKKIGGPGVSLETAARAAANEAAVSAADVKVEDN